MRWEISFTFPERSLYGSTRLKGYKVVSKCSAFISTTVWSSSRNLALDCLNDVSSILSSESDRSHLITKISSGLMISLSNLKETKRSTSQSGFFFTSLMMCLISHKCEIQLMTVCAVFEMAVCLMNSSLETKLLIFFFRRVHRQAFCVNKDFD